MALRKNYFYLVTITDVHTKQKIQDVKQLFCDIIKKNSEAKEEIFLDIDGNEKSTTYYPIEVSQKDEMHLVVDVFNFEDDCLFFRACKQKPSNSFNKRNYETFKSEDISIDNEGEGIEQYTFGYYNYQLGIFSIIKNNGAPDQKILNQIVDKFYKGLNVDMMDIPNRNGVQKLYDAKESQLAQIELEIPGINPVVLQKMFNWKNNELIQIQKNENFKVSFVVKADKRGNLLSKDTGLVRDVINAIKSNIPFYNKAKIRGKAELGKMVTYNFFEENFSNEVDIPYYRIRDGKKKYFPRNQMVEIFKDHLLVSFNENIDFLQNFKIE